MPRAAVARRRDGFPAFGAEERPRRRDRRERRAERPLPVAGPQGPARREGPQRRPVVRHAAAGAAREAEGEGGGGPAGGESDALRLVSFPGEVPVIVNQEMFP